MPAISGSFEGLNNIAGYNPPDTVGDGDQFNHYMQMTNVKFQIWKRTSVFGPAGQQHLWAGFLGNAGQPTTATPLSCMTSSPTGGWLQFSVSGIGIP